MHQLEFENLLTYGSNNKINFDKLVGINILGGINGLGKSSLIDIILFTIYNECSKGEGKEILNIRYEKGYSILRLELNGEKYTIYRGINKGKTSVCLLKEYAEKQTNRQLLFFFFKTKKVNRSSRCRTLGKKS
jgi:DNA repair exonuclease SbcCD ATPase subunit